MSFAGSQSARYASHSSSLERRRVFGGGEPGPEFTHGGDRIYRVPIHQTDSTQSLGGTAGGEEGEGRGGGGGRLSRSGIDIYFIVSFYQKNSVLDLPTVNEEGEIRR